MSEALSTDMDETTSRGQRQRAEFGIVAWTIALPITVYVFGFVYSLPTFVFVFTMYYTRDLKTSFVASGLFTAFAYVVLLNLRMYHGVVDLPNLLKYLPTGEQTSLRREVSPPRSFAAL